MTVQLTQPPKGATFIVSKIKNVTLPHPFCITARHVVLASDEFGGQLGDAALAEADRRGICCGVRGCNLAHSEHETVLTAFIMFDEKPPRDLNEVPGLHDYLLSIKDEAEEKGIGGFAFPNKRGDYR